MASSQPSFMDWMELIGLHGVINDLFSGELTIGDARSMIDEARDTFPDISQDYIALIERTNEVIKDVQLLIDVQEEAVEEFNEAAREFDLEFDHPGDRLLTSFELVELDRLRDEMEDRMQEVADEIEDLAGEIEDLVSEMEDLASDAESMVEDAASELEYAEDELESAYEELMSLSGEVDG